ncbi:DUF2272 domain-containing protein [Sphingomonas adhaesiva]|uniref:DUF2272 domain-containing protein n=1 Tax=Sphingomonas adhaesiva TaxID=28212 RepID=UPI002FF85DE6
MPDPTNERLVTTDGVRLRAEPEGQILRDLTIAERAVDLGAAAVAGWRRVRTADGEGVVFGKYLRAPGRPEVEALLRAAIDEWIRFGKGKGNEDDQPYRGYVGEMWKALKMNYDGASKYPNGEDVPWSAAFISWVVRQASKTYPAYNKFAFASGHSVFVNDAIQARVTGRFAAPFWGYRIDEKRPEIGDIIQRNRGKGQFTYSYAENHADYKSHSDIVVEVTPDAVRVIGGNVGDTVSAIAEPQEYALGPDGFIAPGQRVIALLKNRAGL